MSWSASALRWTITFYQQAISPRSLASCRYLPTCSEYALDAVRMHGAGRGSWLAVRRVLRCHPLHAGGYDPVPEPSEPRARRAVRGPANG